jgi:predicted MPP superfamily phosphohydrolase
MNKRFLTFIGTFLLIYGLINYYIGLRGWQLIGLITSNAGFRWCWVILLVLLALTYPLGRLLARILPGEPGRSLIISGSYWLALAFYLFLGLLLIDTFRLADQWTGILPAAVKSSPTAAAALVILLISIMVACGVWNARHPVIKKYEVTLEKKTTSLETLRVAVVSDIHLGWIIGPKQMKSMTAVINQLNPELVLLAGDIIDEGIDLATEQQIPGILKTLHPEMGVYAILGNHEYLSSNAEKVECYLRKAGVQVLRDQWVDLNGLYLVGRDDRSRGSYYGSPRQKLAMIMEGLDQDKLPVLLMDHQPYNLESVEKAGIDLQISGHTHKGQFWPINYITHAIFEQDWGYLCKNNLQLIVSCGFGTWGPPIRIGNRPEIINLLIKFAP